MYFKFQPGGQERHWVRDGSRPWQGAEAGRRRDLNGPQSKDLGSEKNLFDVNISISISIRRDLNGPQSKDGVISRDWVCKRIFLL